MAFFFNFCKQHKNSLHTFCTSPDGASKRKGEADTQRTPGCTQGQGTKVLICHIKWQVMSQ